MERSIATTARRTAGEPGAARGVRRTPLSRLNERLESAELLHIGLLFVAGALVVYFFSNPERRNFYNHFVWQAEAFLDGRSAIRYPVAEGPFRNDYFQDVMPLAERPGFGLIPFPPMPAILLTPLVALFGLATDAALLAVVVGALNVGLGWRVAALITPDRAAAALATLFFAFGTVHWYAAMLGSTWFLAHVISITFLLLAIMLALEGETRQQPASPAAGGQLALWPLPPPRLRDWLASLRRSGWRGAVGVLRSELSALQFVAGLLFGLAALSRLTVIFGALFFVFVGAGRTFAARAVAAGLGAGIPVLGLLLYNVASTGHLFHPAYEYLYQHEYLPRPELINRDWLIEDPRYIPQNALIMLAWPPEVVPEGSDCGLSLLDPACPVLRPDPLGMSLLLTSPAYLLALPVLRVGWRRRAVLGAGLAVATIAVVNLMHFSQGWVQFGYRFSNDFAPFALLLVTLGIAWLRLRWLAVALVAASIVTNAWGVYWAVELGW